MRRGLSVVAIGGLCLVSWSCPGPNISPEEAVQARRVLVAWLECEECVHGELEAVVGLGNLAVPSLKAALEKGPNAASRESVRRALASSYRSLEAYMIEETGDRPPWSEEEYVATFLDRFVALYRLRGAHGLQAIDSWKARRTLRKAAAGDLGLEAQQAFERSLLGPSYSVRAPE